MQLPINMQLLCQYLNRLCQKGVTYLCTNRIISFAESHSVDRENITKIVFKSPYWLHFKNHSTSNYDSIWVRSRRCGCLVTWFCYQMIAKPGNKTAALSWPDPSKTTNSKRAYMSTYWYHVQFHKTLLQWLYQWWFSSQMANIAESISMTWRHHVFSSNASHMSMGWTGLKRISM